MYIQTSSCRILNTKFKKACFMLAVYTYISSHLPQLRRSPHYHYTKHTAPSTVKAVIDGGKYLRFSLCLSIPLLTSFHHTTPRRDVSFSPLMAKIISITFTSHCYNRRTSLFSLWYLNVILNTLQLSLSLQE